MQGIGRILIVVILAGILYSLYRYQQLFFINKDKPNKTITHKPSCKLKRKDKKRIDEMKESDNISCSNIDQVSLGSLEDVKTIHAQDIMKLDRGYSDSDSYPESKESYD
jgi:hypothetical protein